MTDKPNYNDGNWHRWNGGECPVHPKTEVEAVWHDANLATTGIRRRQASGGAWGNQILKFRVIKEYREPRTIWVFGGHSFETPEAAAAFRDQLVRGCKDGGVAYWPITKFAEVIE